MNNKAQALFIVVAILAMLFVVGMGFFSVSQVERTAAVRHLDSVRAHYIAEAGVVYAQKLLKIDRQGTLIDSEDDLNYKHFAGSDIDLDGDTTPESRWFSVTDSLGSNMGRFAVKVSDEASKLNLNVCAKEELRQLFSSLGLEQSLADTLLTGRPYNAIEELGHALSSVDFNKVKDYLTVYSRDFEIDIERARRVYLNCPSEQTILEAFLGRGVNGAYQKAANLKDAGDKDVTQTLLYKFTSGGLAPTELAQAGGWLREETYYEAAAGTDMGIFAWSNLEIEDGDYYCFLYGASEGDTVGQVYINQTGQGEGVLSAEGLVNTVQVSGGELVLYIKPALDSISKFSHIELTAASPRNGLTKKTTSGTEALVINEVMVKSSREIIMDSPAQIDPGKSFNYVFKEIPQGYYYLVVLAQEPGGLVGDVEISEGKGGKTKGEGLYDGDYFPYTANVTGDRNIHVKIKNNSLGKSSFRGIKILQDPDSEFIEILNLSGEEIDLSNFTFEVYSAGGELIAGWPGRIPESAKIAPYQYIICAVDNADASPTPAGLRGNGIYFQRNWGFGATGIIFDEHGETIDKAFDLLPDLGGTIILKDASGNRVDAVEYQSSQVRDFVSLERPDPAEKLDADSDGIFDGWYQSESPLAATPGLINENSGMYTFDATQGTMVKRNPSSDVIVFNRPLSDLTEVAQLSSGKSWEKFTLIDIARISDRFAYDVVNLGLIGNYKTGEFREMGAVYESVNLGDSGIWEFLNLPATSYLLSLISDDANYAGSVRVAVAPSGKEDFGSLSPLIFSNGVAFFGTVTLTENPSSLQIKVINDSGRRLGLKEIQLEPVEAVSGRINVNTAKPEAFRSIINSDFLAQVLSENKPIGVKDDRKLGVGDLLLLNSDFLPYHKALTVKSDVYEIFCRGEYYPQSRTIAYQDIRTVLERGSS